MNNPKRNIKIIAISLLLILGLYVSAAPALYKAAEYYEAQDGKEQIAINLYTKIYKIFPYSSQAPKALGSLISLNSPKGESILITKHFTSSFTQNHSPNIKGINYYKYLAEKYPDSEAAKFMTLKIGQHYAALGLFDKAEECFIHGLKVDEESYIPSESSFELIKLYLRNNDPQKALTSIETYRAKYPDSMKAKMYLLEGDAYQLLGNYDMAEETYKRVLQIDYKLNKAEEAIEGDLSVYDQEKLEERLIRNEKLKGLTTEKQGKIVGKFTKNKKTIKNMRIYLLDENGEEPDFCAKDLENYPSTILDEEGNYEFTNIIPGKYSIGIVTFKEDLEGYTLAPELKTHEIKEGQTIVINSRLVPTLALYKPFLTENRENVTFKWQPVKNAHHYTLSLALVKRNKNEVSFSSALVKENIFRNELAFPKEELLSDCCTQQVNQSKSSESAGKKNEEGESERNLSLLHQDGKCVYTWSVKAYDENNKLMTDSSGYEFFIDNERLTIFSIADDGNKKTKK